MPALLSNASSTGNSTAWNGGKGFLTAAGTFGGTSLQLQYLASDNTTWVPVGSAITAAGSAVVEMPPGRVRMAVTGGTPSGLYVAIEQIRGV